MKISILAVIFAVACSFVIFWVYYNRNQNVVLEDKVKDNFVYLNKDDGLMKDNIKKTNKNNMKATISTNKGDIIIDLFSNITPETVANFFKLSQSGFYDGVKFHRVIKDFMIQSGDPYTKDDSKKNVWGTGGPGYTFKDEITEQNKNFKGTISMANAGPDTNGSQFFINTKDNNFLDTKHTVFGKVVFGMEVVEYIENSKTDSFDRPFDPIIINTISFE